MIHLIDHVDYYVLESSISWCNMNILNCLIEIDIKIQLGGGVDGRLGALYLYMYILDIK